MSYTESSYLPPSGDADDSTFSAHQDQSQPNDGDEKRVEKPDHREPAEPKDSPPSHWPGRQPDLLAHLMAPGTSSSSLGRIENYEILGIVGQGAMGIVLRAFDDSLRRIVAIKLMAPHLVASPSAKERFKREARSAAGVSHPNVVTIHAVSETRGVPFLVMEYIEGQSLAQRIHSRPLDALDVMRIAQQMASGLAAAHRQGIVHRDIKPSNIMLEDSIERVRIADFGLARVAMEHSSLTSDGQMVGTPSYMSPEQVNGDRLDPRSDLFSVGCVMYAMLTGHSPFEASNGLAAARAVLHKDPEPLTKVCERPLPALCELVHRLLQKGLKDRIQSAIELERHLGLLIRSWDSTTDSTTVQLEPLPKERQSRASIRIIALVLIIALPIAAAFFASRLYVSADRPFEIASQSDQPASQASRVLTGTTDAVPVIQVSQTGLSRYVSLSDAVADASPGSVIEILDSGPYSDPIQIDEPIRLQGLTIAGRQTVITNSGAEPLIRVAGVCDVTIEGLVLNVAGHQHGLEVVGDCSGLTFRKSLLQTLDPSKPSISLIHLHEGAGGSLERPLTLHDLELKIGAVGLVMGDPGGSTPVHDVTVSGCRFICNPDGPAIPLIVFDGLQRVVVSRNLFENGSSVFSLSLSRPDSVRRFEFAWNTIHRFEALLILNDSHMPQDFRLQNNLMLQTARCTASDVNVEQLAPWFTGNVWQHAPDEDGKAIETVAERIDQIQFRATTPGAPGYLVPIDPDLQAGRSVQGE